MTILTIPDPYADACQDCFPGDPPPSLPVGYPRAVQGGVETDHECWLCGTAWTTLWRDGWPVERVYADVTEDQESAARRQAA